MFYSLKRHLRDRIQNTMGQFCISLKRGLIFTNHRILFEIKFKCEKIKLTDRHG